MNSRALVIFIVLGFFQFKAYSQIKVSETGNVGVGNIANPVSRLELENNKWLRLNPVTGSSGILFYESGTPTATTVPYGAQIFYDGNTHLFKIVTKENNIEKIGLSIQRTTGNVGIRTLPNSGFSLSVDGNTEFLGNFKINGGNTGSYPLMYFNKASLSITAELGAYPQYPVGSLGSNLQPWAEMYADYIEVYSIYETSDARLKENIVSLESTLSKVNQLRPVKFDFKELSLPEDSIFRSQIQRLNERRKNHCGFLAQEVQNVMPDVVHYDKDNDKYLIDYTALIPQLVVAIQEQQKQIDAMQVELLKLSTTR